MPLSPLLGPVVAVVAWNLLIQIWMYATRLPAMRRTGITFKGHVGTRSGALEGKIPDRVNLKAHNYNHLMEQPTLFYAIAITLALMDFGGGIQSTINIVAVRFTIFALATFSCWA